MWIWDSAFSPVYLRLSSTREYDRKKLKTSKAGSFKLLQINTGWREWDG